MSGSISDQENGEYEDNVVGGAAGGPLIVDGDKKRNKLGFQRVSVACAHCRKRKIRCLIADGDPQSRCQNCIRLKKECVFYPVALPSIVESKNGSGGSLTVSSYEGSSPHSVAWSDDTSRLTTPDPFDLTTHRMDWTSSYVGESSKSIPHESSLGQNIIADAANDLGDLDALLNPSKYFNELDELERYAIDKCRLTSILPIPSRGVTYVPIPLYLNSEHWTDSLNHVVDVMTRLNDCGFSKEAIVVLVQDVDRNDVIRAKTISTKDIVQFRTSVSGYYYDPSELGVLQDLVENLLNVFGASLDVGEPVTYRTSSKELPHKVRVGIDLLCFLLPLAIVSYTGSHCSDLGPGIFGTKVDSVRFRCTLMAQGDYWYSFKLRSLACLHSFIGGPVWTFGNNELSETARLSISIEQFADLWGPLYTIPLTHSSDRLLAIHTEGGILFRKSGSLDSSPETTDETPLHWIASSPVHIPNGLQNRTSADLIIDAKGEEKLPTDLTPFSSSDRLLIGTPTSAGSTATLTSNQNVGTAPRLTLQAISSPGFVHNADCDLNLEEFGRLSTFKLHPIGTSSAYYLPEEYQLGFSGGQYINIGLQKVYKRRPAITYKTRILECLSKPRGLKHNDVQQVLQNFLGLEMSACTRNAQRATLEDTLKLAYPGDFQAIDAACSSGDGQEIVRFLCDLEKTGLNHELKANLFWPLSSGIREVLELSDRPAWFDLLEDSRDSACFAVASPRCLSFTCLDSNRGFYWRRCSRMEYPGLSEPALKTAIEIDPGSPLRTPLTLDDRVKLPCGQLQIQNYDVPTQLAFFTRKSTFSGWKSRLNSSRDFVHRELVNNARQSPYTAPLLIIDQP